MSFGDNLVKEFNKNINALGNTHINEVNLFTELANAFATCSYQGTKCSVIHGHRSFVSFKETKGKPFYYAKDSRNIVTCELADLMFIVINGEKLKLSYVQNKFQRKNYTAITDKFHADMRQFYLLNKRPIFERKGHIHSILKNATHESICSYGVFYQNNSNYDMNYCSAHCLNTIPSYNGTRRGRLETNTWSTKNSIIKGDTQCNFTSGIKEFGDELVKWTIGNPYKIKDISGSLDKEIIRILTDLGIDVPDREGTIETTVERGGDSDFRDVLLLYKNAILIKIG